VRLNLDHALLDELHQRDRVFRREEQPNADDLMLVDQFADDLNYFVDATNCLTDGPMMAFH